MAEPDQKKDPFDGEYVGNIWGWKFSLFGLALIVVMSAWMLIRHISLGVPFGGDPDAREQPGMTAPADSLSGPDTLGSPQSKDL